MNRIIVILIMMLGWNHFTLAQQTVNFSGVVKDSLLRPVELANVVAYHAETDRITSYAVTDEEGRFYLKLEDGTTYVMRSTFIGYKTSQDTIIGRANENNPYVITLKESVKKLQNITIEEEFPVMISGDTISYKADAFNKGNERKLEDVLENIPGIDVDENGEIKIQGKTVEKVLVDGKEFFEGDTKLAVQNIPSNAVERVQVLRNFSDISPMSSLGNNEDRLAINIQLAEDKKNMTFGDVEAGVGLDGRYLAHANLFRYTPKSTVNFIGDANNIGRQAFTPRDYFRFMGGMRNMMSQSGSNFSLTDDNMGFMNLQNDRARSVDTELGALNFNYVPNKKWNLSGFGIVSGARTTLQSLSDRTYVNANETNNKEILSTSEYQKNVSGLAKFKAKYTPNADTQLEYELFAKGSTLTDDINRISDNLGITNVISDEADQKPVNVRQRLDAYIGLNDKNIVSMEASYEYNRQNPFSNYTSDRPLFASTLPIVDTDGYNFQQSKSIVTHQQEFAANWYYILNRTNHLNFRFGNSYVNQRMETSIDQVGNAALDNENYRNNFTYLFSDVYAGVNWRSRLGKFIINPGIYGHRFRTTDKQGDLDLIAEQVRWLPELTVNFDIQSSQTLRFRYNLEARFMDVQKVAQGLLVQNYNNLYVGNQNLSNSTFHNFNLNYTNYSLFSHFSIYGGLNYQRILDNINESVEYENLERISTSINVIDPNEMAMFYGNFEKTFKKLKISTGANIYYSSTTNLINQIANKNESYTQQYEVSLETNLLQMFTLELGYERTNNQYSSSSTSNDYLNDQPFVDVDIKIRPWLTLSSDYRYNNYRAADGSSQSTYEFFNAALRVQKEKSPWLFTLQGTNLLDTEAIRRDSFSDNLVGTYSYFVQPRYFTFSVKYDI
ncbi:MAG: carboxypeptidase regulatory-like domain-containing protein [Reichenbachiella sp.]|uniref:carboxypeptidase regulatory-like domain-containing protein n=1 Tax=Reichenbachiella sp. TaxID=2184521 RepID=UPI00326432B8